MNVAAYLNRIYPFEWWNTEFKNRPRDHIGPITILGATTVLVTVIWNKYAALSFVGVAIISYPLYHHQIVYLMFLDAHETVYAVAVVSIQVFRMKFPQLDKWSLPMSVALAYAITIRGMKIRQLMQQQSSQIGQLQRLSGELSEQVESVTRRSLALKEALTTLRQTIKKSNTIDEKEIATTGTRNNAVIALEADHRQISTYLDELTGLCKIALDESGLLKQLQKIDGNEQKLAEQTEKIELKNRALSALIVSLHEGNSRFYDLIAKAQRGEADLQSQLLALSEWFSQVTVYQH